VPAKKTDKNPLNDLKKDPSIGRVLNEVMQSHERRKPLLKFLEGHFQKRIVVFMTSFYFDNGLITDEDATMLEDVLLSSKIERDLLLIINSPGGFGLAAERIVNVCRHYSKNGYEVLVPHMAKSAATLICFGANKIWLGGTSELGPIDPQLRLQGRPVSVYNVLKSYDQLLEKAQKVKGRIEPFLQQLQAYDPRYMQQLRQEMKLSESMAIDLVKNGMMKGRSERVIRKCIQMFLDPVLTLEHGRPIYYNQAKQCDLKVESIDANNSEWGTIWELYYRYDHILSRHFGKVVESSDDSFTVRGQNHGDHDEE
jgi:ClpP class serine protease